MVVKFKLLVSLLITLLLAGCNDALKPPQTGQAAPAFSLERLDGSHAEFPADLNGKVVAIQFWADWCPPCINEMILLAPVYQHYKSQGLVILAVNMRQNKATVEKIVEQLDAPYEFLLDTNGEVADSYGVNALPTSFIVDRQGVLRTRILGESTPETFENIIQALL